jgi:hypothetical protein
MFAAYAAWSARKIELQALATLATLAQISTPSAAHFLKSHQLLVQKFAADRDRQKKPRLPFEGSAGGRQGDGLAQPHPRRPVCYRRKCRPPGGILALSGLLRCTPTVENRKRRGGARICGGRGIGERHRWPS